MSEDSVRIENYTKVIMILKMDKSSSGKVFSK